MEQILVAPEGGKASTIPPELTAMAARQLQLDGARVAICAVDPLDSLSKFYVVCPDFTPSSSRGRKVG